MEEIHSLKKAYTSRMNTHVFNTSPHPCCSNTPSSEYLCRILSSLAPCAGDELLQKPDRARKLVCLLLVRLGITLDGTVCNRLRPQTHHLSKRLKKHVSNGKTKLGDKYIIHLVCDVFQPILATLNSGNHLRQPGPNHRLKIQRLSEHFSLLPPPDDEIIGGCGR